MTPNKPPIAKFWTVSSAQADTLLFAVSLILMWTPFYSISATVQSDSRYFSSGIVHTGILQTVTKDVH